jgi:regulatory protein
VSHSRPPSRSVDAAELGGLVGPAARLLDPARAPRQGARVPCNAAEGGQGDALADAAVERQAVDGPARSSQASHPRRKAIELLSRREHSRRELVRKLAERGFAPAEVDEAVVELARQGWQDDARYAAALVRSRTQGGYGPVWIRAELRTHGLDEALIEAALDACEMDWARSARQLLCRRFGSQRASTRQELARRGAFLQRRGFELDDVRRALAQAEDGG